MFATGERTVAFILNLFYLCMKSLKTVIFREIIQQYRSLICDSKSYMTPVTHENHLLEYLDYDTVKTLVNVSLVFDNYCTNKYVYS